VDSALSPSPSDRASIAAPSVGAPGNGDGASGS
jgi:hypothetical protein